MRSSLDSGLVAALTTASDVAENSSLGTGSVQQSMIQTSSVDTSNSTVDKFGVENYPNPFNPTTIITYQIPKDGRVTLRVYDILGREVVTLADGNQSAGIHYAAFDGSRFASGVYFYRLTAPGVSQVKKMVLAK